MKSSTKPTANNKKTIKVIKNAHSPAEQRAMGDRWAEHRGPRMSVAETLAYAARLEAEKEKQPAK